MKFLVIGDLHIGVGKDDPWHENIRAKALEQIFEYTLENDIKTLVFLGDIFDDRKYLTHRSLEFNRKHIIEPIVKHDLEAIVIIGNHDAYHTNTLTPNAVTETFGKIKNFKVVECAETINIGGTDVDFVSWICDDNEIKIREFVKDSKSKYCFGHFELVGFYYYSGILADSGADPQFLSKYDFVGSGHYHTINGSGNVMYLGTPYTITSNDSNEERGFFEFDTENMKTPKFIPNPKVWHRHISYPMDANIDTYDFDYSEFEGVVLNIDLNDKPDKFFENMEQRFEEVVHKIRVKNNYAVNSALNTVMKVDADVMKGGGVKELVVEYLKNDDMIPENELDSILLKFNNLYTEAMSKRGME